MRKILLVISLFLTIVVSGCQCTLHTHYYNDRGVCNCGHDIAYELAYENGKYVSSSQSVKPNVAYYYKFTSHGENGVDFYLESEDVAFDRIEIGADGMLQTVPNRNDDTKKFYTYDEALVNGRIYYLKVTYIGDASIKLIIKDRNI